MPAVAKVAKHKKLSQQERIAAVILYMKGSWQQDEIAAELGVSSSAISKAVKDCMASASDHSLQRNTCGLHQEQRHASRNAATNLASLEGVRHQLPMAKLQSTGMVVLVHILVRVYLTGLKPTKRTDTCQFRAYSRCTGSDVLMQTTSPNDSTSFYRIRPSWLDCMQVFDEW
jgi:predicted transcriptional regulator